MTRTIRAVLFDLDGTLLDTETLSDQAIIQAFGESLSKEIRDQHSEKLPWELKKQLLGKRGDEWTPIAIRYAQERWGVAKDDDDDDSSELPPPPSATELWSQWETNLNKLCEDVQECPGASQLVERLAALNVPMAIATSSRKAAVDKKRLKHETMFGHMKAIVAGDDPAVKQGKPAPDIYLEAARQLNVSPSECLVFEDALSGAKAGKAAGCHVVAVPDPRMDKSVFGIADEVLDSLWDFDGRPWGLSFTMN